jgi:hypothetical protein
MTNETLILLQSKCDNGPIIPMTTINIPMDPSIYIIKILKTIIGPKNQNWNPKLNVPYLWNNYVL